MLQSSVLRLGIRVAALAIIIIAASMTTNTDAQRRGGGGPGISRSGGSGIGRSVQSAPAMRSPSSFRVTPMTRSLPSVRSMPSVRSISGVRSVPRTTATRATTTRKITTRATTTTRTTTTRNVVRSTRVAPKVTAPSKGPALSARTLRSPQVRSQSVAGQVRRAANRNLVTRGLVKRNVQGVGRASALRNHSLASLSTRDNKTRTLARATFRGRLAGQDWKHAHRDWHWRHHRPIIVIGWIGPLFWPYAYGDFIDYTYWPYAYDVFWPYAYDDLYVGMFGPYAYEGTAYSVTAPSGRRVRAARPASTDVIVCGERVPALTDWPIQQIAQAVQPDDTQRAALNDLKDAAAKALERLQSSCPGDLPSTPTGRFTAMRVRIETMLQAASLVQQPLQRFYDALSDEQKARFNAVSPETPQARRSAKPPGLAYVCSAEAAKATDLPSERLERELRPTEAQRITLNALNEATAKAANILKTRCPEERALTPPGRITAMEQRLNAMLEATNIVQPALETFYGSLTDEQKARFNRLGTPS
jgi:hypothetical protein